MTNSSQKNLVLITRPATDADEFANDVRTIGLTPLVEPMMGIIPVEHAKPNFRNYAAIVFTSANGVRTIGCPPEHRDIPVFTVGSHTATEAMKQGYSHVFSADGAGVDLGPLIRKKLVGGDGRILHIRGEHVAVPLEDILLKDKIQADSLVVYKAKSEDHFTPACHQAVENGDIGIATFFSKRTAENFLRLIEKEGLNASLSTIKLLCISQAVLECVQHANWAGAYSAKAPNRTAMLELLKTLSVEK